MSMGKNIACFRKCKGYTQEELGQKIGVTNQAVSKWESETSMPDIMILPKIANALDITFYPKIEICVFTPVSVLGISAYAVLTLLPVILEIKEKIKWNCLISKI